MLARNDCSESRFMWMRAREEARGRSFRAVVPLSRVSKTKIMPIRSTTTRSTTTRARCWQPFVQDFLGEVSWVKSWAATLFRSAPAPPNFFGHPSISTAVTPSPFASATRGSYQP